MPTFYIEMNLEYDIAGKRLMRTVEDIRIEAETMEEAYRLAEARYSKSAYVEAYAIGGYEG